MILDQALADAARRLTGAGVENAAREARRLAQIALGLDAGGLLKRRGGALDAAERAAFESLVARRAGREPFARIVGEKEFWSLAFRLVPETLIPRPESETLVEAALAHSDRRIADRATPLRVLDLGVGSGCLLLALLSELRGAMGLGVDMSEAALACARTNAERLGLAGRTAWRRADWADGLEETFDIVLANPPYVALGDWPALEPEVRDHDPRAALVAGEDGLAAYRRIVPALARILPPAGFACLEIGAGQQAALVRLADENGLCLIEARRDLAGIERCVVLAKAEK